MRVPGTRKVPGDAAMPRCRDAAMPRCRCDVAIVL